MRAVVVRPFGMKEGIDFDLVDRELIAPALSKAGILGTTTAEITRTGHIREDMFQLLITADVVIADISVHHANVFYELGIRHALRPRGTALIRANVDTIPFDLASDRFLAYVPRDAAASVERLSSLLSMMLVTSRVDSPVYLMLPRLVAPSASVLTVVPLDFREYVERAHTSRFTGDLCLFAHEVRGLVWESEGLRTVTRALYSLGAWEAARDGLEALLAKLPSDVEVNQRLGTVFQRLSDLPRSSQAIQRVIESSEATAYDRAEAFAQQGRNAKMRWIEQWDDRSGTEARVPALASSLLTEAIALYSQGFEHDLNHFYSGLNALALLRIQAELRDAHPDVWMEQFETDDEGVREAKAATTRFQELAGAVQLSIRASLATHDRDLDKLTERKWAEISQAEYGLLTSATPRGVRRRYELALIGATPLMVDSVRGQLSLFQRLDLLGDVVREVAAMIDDSDAASRSAAGSHPEARGRGPSQVLLFTGHMIDAVGRPEPRFPPGAEAAAREMILQAIRQEMTGGDVVGIAGGSAGGDILFHEVCEELGIESHLFLAMPPREFAAVSVQHGGSEWMKRFRVLSEKRPPRILHETSELPAWLQTKGDYSIWQRNNLWLLFNALSFDAPVTLIALWDGRTSDGPGGTNDLVSLAMGRGNKVVRLAAHELRQYTETAAPVDVRTVSPLSLPSLTPPPDLIQAIATRSVVAVVGAGFSAQAGLPVWADLYKELVDVASGSTIDERTAETLYRALDRGQYEEVSKRLVSALSPTQIAGRLAEVLAERSGQPAAAHRELADVSFSGVMTYNLDTLVETALRVPASRVFTHLGAERALDAYNRGETFVLKLSGRLDDPSSVLLSLTQQIEEVKRNRPLTDLVDRIALGKTLLFLGMSNEGITDFMRAFNLRQRRGQHHFAVVRVSDDSWDLSAQNLRDHYGIETLPFVEADQSTALVDFLAKLRTEGQLLSATIPVEQARPREGSGRLARLDLENIGPFEQLSLELDPSWNCLLGDNGVGKSTILKAIAIGLGADETGTYADRILRKKTTGGQIALITTTGATYRTIIETRTGAGVEISRPDGLPDPVWLALGFPALRTTTWGAVSREGVKIASSPGAQDLLPILADRPDPRLDALKQRVITLDHWIRTERTSEAVRYEALVEKFFAIATELARGIALGSYTVDALAGRIMVNSHNVAIPFESLSQGTISLISWIGVLLQRLYDVTPQGEDPMQRYALALIDEIDAHMHPAWQRTVTSELGRLFPNVQFIATTHSPLVVGGMAVDQVYRLRRGDDGQVQVERPQQPLQGLGVAGLLTSELFDLGTHLDPPTEQALARKRALLAQDFRTPAEEQELSELDTSLGNVDYTRVVRDPLYRRFVDAMTRIEGATPAGEPLTDEERRRRDQVADEILRELVEEEEENA